MQIRFVLVLITLTSILSAQQQQRPARRMNAGTQQAVAQQPEQQVPPGGIEGQVVNAATGEPVRKVSLVLMPVMSRQGQGQGPGGSYSTNTDASGQFSMKDVKPGTYMLMGERTGFVRGSYGARSQMQQGSPLTIASGQVVKAISFRLQPHAVISGRILDEDGEPLANVQVQATSNRYIQGRRQLVPNGAASTNDLGEYRIFGLAPGRYYVSAIHRSRMSYGPMSRAVSGNPDVPEEDYAPTYYPGMTDSSGAVPIAIAAGQPVGNIDMKLVKTHTVRVRGHVTGGAGRGRTMVMLNPRDSMMGMFDRNLSAPQGPDGKFEIRGVTPGSYWLTAQSSDDGVRYVARIPVNVGNSPVEGVEVTLKPGMEISGIVSSEGQTKVDLAQVNISLQPKEFAPMMGGSSARVKDDGTFVIRNVFPDTYHVAALAGGQSFYVKSLIVGQQEAPKGEITIVDGAPQSLTVVVSSAAAQVSGSVFNEKKEPALGSTAVLIPSADRRDQQQYYKTATVDQNGTFNFTGIAPGDYILLAWQNAEAGAWQDPEFLARFETKGKTLHVKENDVVTAELEALNADSGQ